MRHLTTLRFIDAVAKAGSIRKAAEGLAITPSALNRRIQAFEEELGSPVFERLPRGVRLNPAGELMLHHLRTQLSDLERVRGQIADLRGERRGHVGVACSQALLPFFLPEQIAAYRAQHPAVTFDVRLRDREAAEAALAAHEADIAVVFEPVLGAEVATLMTAPQTVHAVMAADHPLAGRETVRLRDCLAHPVALPTPGTGVRRLLDAALARASHRAAAAVASDSFEFLRSYARAEAAVTFQIPLGLAAPLTPGLVARPVDGRDLTPGLVHLCQLRGRTLPVAAARFSDQLARALAIRFGAA